MGRSRKLFSQSSIMFAARVFGAGMIFLVQAAMARVWGSEILAEYLLLIATVNLAAMVMPLGFQTIGSYFAAEYRAKGQRRTLTLFVLRAYAQIAIVAAILIAAFLLATPIFDENLLHVSQLWAPSALLGLSTASIFVNGAVLVGLKRPYAGFLVDGLVRPLMIAVAFVFALIFVAESAQLSAMVWTFALIYLLAAAAYAALTFHALRSVDFKSEASTLDEKNQSKRWWRFALPWVLISIATDFFFDIDLLILSGFLDKPELAVFGVCTRIFALSAFGITAVYAILLPDMFEAEANDDRAAFHKQLGDANLVAAGLAVLMTVGMVVGGPILLWLFGDDFSGGALPLVLLSLVLVLRAVFGPASMVLSLHDRPWASLPAIGVGLLVLVMANILLVPHWGINGAASAAVVAIGIWSALLWLTAKKITGIDVSILPRIKTLVSQRGQAIEPTDV